MESNIKFSHLFLFSLILLVSTSDGRKDLGKYWEEKMKGQPLPEAIKGLINMGTLENVEAKYNAADGQKSFAKEFDPRSNISVYHDDVNTNEVKSMAKDCETHNDGSMSKKPYMDQFEPRPNISVYND